MTDDLLEAASAARAFAHVPYSGFQMGAAVRDDRDVISRGALIENVSLGLAMCAERIALFTAATTGARPIELALVSKRTAGKLTWPCGACLQVALELGGPGLMVHVSDLDGEHASRPVGELLPLGPETGR